MRLARTATSPPRDEQVWPAGVEPAISGSQNRRGRPSPLQPEGPGRGPGGVREVDDRGIEPRFTAVSERRLPSRPVVDSVGADRNSASAEFRSRRSLKPAASRPGRCEHVQGVARESHPAPRIHSPRARYKPCDAVSPGGVEPPSPAVGARRSSIELRREALSTGIEPASPGRQPGRISQTRPRACKYPERDSNPRFRCERPASSTARRSGHERGCDGWGRTSIYRVTTGRPAVERRRIVHWTPRPDSNGRTWGRNPLLCSAELRGGETEAAGFEPAQRRSPARLRA